MKYNSITVGERKSSPKEFVLYTSSNLNCMQEKKGYWQTKTTEENIPSVWLKLASVHSKTHKKIYICSAS